ncbi:MAG: NUDIX domain-containing protein [Bacteroidota bacterium]
MHQNYKLFIKDKLILFTENVNIPNRGKNVIFYRYQGMTLLAIEFEHFIKSKKFKTLVVYRKKNVDKLFKSFLGRYKLTKAAGGAVISKKDEVLMIYRHGRWDLPKGKKNSGEKNKETAIREVMEETGMEKLEITKKLAVTFHFYRRNKRLIIKKTHWFLMKAKRNQEMTPALKEGILKVKWIPYEKARKKSNKTFRSISEVLCKAISCEPN